MIKTSGEKKYYGLDIWRPEILINYLNSLPDNSILQYSDIGCHFNINGLDRLKDYVKMTEKNNTPLGAGIGNWILKDKVTLFIGYIIISIKSSLMIHYIF